jgi:hypothetical protein
MSDMQQQQQQGRCSGRVIYNDPTSPPCRSAHHRRLGEGDGECDAPPVQCHEELLAAFWNDVDSFGPCDDDEDVRKRRYRTLAKWSCIVGYCKALTTHADALRRHSVFRVPLDRLRRLVGEEFLPLLDRARLDVYNNGTMGGVRRASTGARSGRSPTPFGGGHRIRIP